MTKVKVSERAALARLNRAMANAEEVVKKARPGSRAFNELGEYYAINTGSNVVTATHIDLEKWGREVGALKPYEEVGGFQSHRRGAGRPARRSAPIGQGRTHRRRCEANDPRR